MIKDKSIFFLHCIDDIFMVWTKSEEQLKDLMNELNQKPLSIKFNYKLVCKRIQFLDTLVYVGQQNKLQLLFSENQVTPKTFLMQNWNIRTH